GGAGEEIEVTVAVDVAQEQRHRIRSVRFFSSGKLRHREGAVAGVTHDCNVGVVPYRRREIGMAVFIDVARGELPRIVARGDLHRRTAERTVLISEVDPDLMRVELGQRDVAQAVTI